MKFKLQALFLVLCIIFSQGFMAFGQENPNSLSILITRNANKNSPAYLFIQHLEKKLKQKIKVIVEPLSKDIKEKISSGEANLALLTPYNFAHIQSQFPQQIITPLASPGTQDGEMAFYHACIFARKDIPVKSLQDLPKYSSQLRFSFTNASSTSGHVLPRLQLASEGMAFPEDIFKDVDFSGGHYNTILAVLQGDAEVGGVAYEHLRDYLKQHPSYKEKTQVLWQSPPLPHSTLVARTDLPESIRKKITHILLNMHLEMPKEDFAIVKQMWDMDEIKCFVPSAENIYVPIIETTKKAGGMVNFLNHYEDKLQRQERELVKGAEILKTQSKEIVKQKKVLSNQLILIQNQQTLVYVFLTLLISAIAVGFVIYRSYQLKKKVNHLILRESELNFLKSQLNPHFLFNTLNNVYALCQVNSSNALNMVGKLSEMMRYMMYDCTSDRVPLVNEIEYLNNYIELNRLKTDKDLNVQMAMEGNPKNLKIVPLLLINFLENSFKHGDVHFDKQGYICIHVSIKNHQMTFLITNSFRHRMQTSLSKQGIGLENVKQRLSLLYPSKHSLKIHQNHTIFEVELKLQLD
jgi:phosphate/phosphite/phosphonate ABC transporter binding protein